MSIRATLLPLVLGGSLVFSPAHAQQNDDGDETEGRDRQEQGQQDDGGGQQGGGQGQQEDAGGQQGGGGKEGGGSQGPTVDLPLIGEISLPQPIANLFGIESRGSEQDQGAQQPPAVVYAVAEPKTVGENFRFLGRIDAIERVSIMARVSGYIDEVAFEGGDVVEQGDLLFRIEPDRYEAAVAAAEAELQGAEAQLLQAEQAFNRQEELRESGTVSESRLEDATAALRSAQAGQQQAQAQLRQAQLDLGYTDITAAIGGRMSEPYQTRGNYVSSASSAIADLVQLDPIWGTFALGENRLATWRRLGIPGAGTGAPQDDDARLDGFNLTLLLPDGSRYDNAGTLAFIGNSIDASTGTVEVRVRFDNPDNLLLPNQNVTLLVEEADPPRYPVVPQAAVQLGRDGRAIWVVRDDDTVSRLPVTTEQGPAPGTVAITEGLSGGERVVVRGAMTLEDGTRVDPRRQGADGAAPSGGGGGGDAQSQDGDDRTAATSDSGEDAQ